MVIAEDYFSQMIAISRYFGDHAEMDTSFQPEFIASQTINKMIETLEELKKDDIQKMLDILNEVENTDHYNGSGWLDYKMHISGLLIQNGFEVDWGHSQKMKLK